MTRLCEANPFVDDVGLLRPKLHTHSAYRYCSDVRLSNTPSDRPVRLVLRRNLHANHGKSLGNGVKVR